MNKAFAAALALWLLSATAHAGPLGATSAPLVPQSTFATSTVDLIPEKHLSNLIGKTSATVCIAGDSTATNTAVLGNFVDPQQSPFNMLTEQLRAQNPQITSWNFKNFAIGGSNEAQFTQTGVATGLTLPSWFVTPSNTWASYVQAANCDVLFYMWGTNASTAGMLGGSAAATFINTNMANINGWAYVPNVIIVTTKATNPVVDSTDDGASSAHISQAAFHRYFARSNALGWTQFPKVSALGFGLVDLGRHQIGRTMGFDVDAQFLESVPAYLQNGLTLTNSAVVGVTAGTVGYSQNGDYRLTVDLGNVGGSGLFSECQAFGVGLGQWVSNYVRLNIGGSGNVVPKLVVDGSISSAPLQTGSSVSTTNGQDVSITVTKSGMHVTVVVNGVIGLDTIAATYTGSPPNGTPINFSCVSSLGAGPYTFDVTEFWQGKSVSTDRAQSSASAYGYGTTYGSTYSCSKTDAGCQGGNSYNHQRGSSANLDREYIYSLNFSVPLQGNRATSGISAAGATQGTATALTTPVNQVTNVSANQGVLLYGSVLGFSVTVTNASATALNVYPPTGGNIANGSANAAYSLAAGTTAIFTLETSTYWAVR